MIPDNVLLRGVIILQGVFMKFFKYFSVVFFVVQSQNFNSSLLAMGVPYNAALLACFCFLKPDLGFNNLNFY